MRPGRWAIGAKSATVAESQHVSAGRTRGRWLLVAPLAKSPLAMGHHASTSALPHRAEWTVRHQVLMTPKEPRVTIGLTGGVRFLRARHRLLHFGSLAGLRFAE
jgi:hypothetical protein